MEYYKPNKSNTGNAIGLSVNSKAGKLYVNLVKQSGPQKFKGGKQFSISLNSTEIGALLNVIERGIEWKAYHKSTKGETSITAAPYVNKAGAKDGFTLGVFPKGMDDKFGFWFNANEARELRSYLEFSLEKIFSADYSANKARAKERISEDREPQNVEEPQTQEVEAEQSEIITDEDSW